MQDGHVWQTARVVIDPGGALGLAFGPVADCARCRTGRGCGAGVFSRLFGRRRIVIPVPRGRGLVPGQRVRVGIRADRLLAACWGLYGVPLLAFLAGAVLGARPFSGILADLAALAAGLVCGAMAWLAMRSRLTRARLVPRLEPLAGRCPAGGEDPAP